MKNSKKNIIILSIVLICEAIYLSYLLYEHFTFTRLQKNIKSKVVCIKYKDNYWIEDFSKYFKNNDIKSKTKNLKTELDDISIQYVDKYIENSKYWNICLDKVEGYSRKDLWSNYDKKLAKDFKNKKVPAIYNELKFNPYIWRSSYGMLDLPKDTLNKINGKAILDIGAWPGDTIYLFHKKFPKSKIYAYEPVDKLIAETKLNLEKMKKENKTFSSVKLIKKGISNKEEKGEIEFKYKDKDVQITTLDKEHKRGIFKNVGLIKMDIEGYETPAIEGSKEIIKKYKPVLVIAMYHTPQDFFELKDKLKNLNPDYKFMIRRSEDIISDGDLVLIAY